MKRRCTYNITALRDLEEKKSFVPVNSTNYAHNFSNFLLVVLFALFVGKRTAARLRKRFRRGDFLLGR